LSVPEESEITMATDIAVAAVSGIFLNNEVFNLEGAIKSAALSVAKFSTVGSSSESVASVLSFIQIYQARLVYIFR